MSHGEFKIKEDAEEDVITTWEAYYGKIEEYLEHRDADIDSETIGKTKVMFEDGINEGEWKYLTDIENADWDEFVKWDGEWYLPGNWFTSYNNDEFGFDGIFSGGYMFISILGLLALLSMVGCYYCKKQTPRMHTPVSSYLDDTKPEYFKPDSVNSDDSMTEEFDDDQDFDDDSGTPRHQVIAEGSRHPYSI